jgi:L-histidine N-alpha-methyltransferase
MMTSDAPNTQARSGIDGGRLLAQFASDVQYYLMQQPRQLPSRYLYDELGSALFEAICRLPWYPITRAEGGLLRAYGEEILQRVTPSTVLELGSGSGEKLKMLLEAAGPGPVNVHLIDLSAAALEHARRTLAPFDWVRVTAHQATYEAGLGEAARSYASSDRVLVLFLGSNIGNFDPPACDALLREIRRELRAGDALLLGADLVKPASKLQLAYDDPLGVTAAFNRNLLVRVNRELGGDFAIDRFAHRAVWNDVASRVEMHLVAGSAMDIHVPSAGVEFAIAAGESIWTESSYKYRSDEIAGLLEATGFRVTEQWLDAQDRFALTLAEAI